MDLLKKYLERVKKDSKKTDRIAIKVYSEILGCFIWIVETDHDLHSLNIQGVSEIAYTLGEIKQLKKISDKDSLKALHKVKEVFENSKIEQIITKEDSNNEQQ